ncbi:MAG: lytic murein transglycosylase, partial [Alphaproteobacteria bacterium]|nr:lytic murein transglycosylase [Alphaproteobacteria bacterium]
MLKIHRWFILLGLLFIVFIALSIDFSEKKENSDFKRWKDSMVKELNQAGISENTIKKFQDNANFSQSVLDSYNARVNNSVYRISVSEDVLLQAQVFYKDNKSWLEEGKEKHKVLPEVVVAMFGINSSFGEKMGETSAINVLATLAFNPNSSDEFKAELLAFLSLIDRGYFDVNVLANNDGTFTYLGIKPTLYLLNGVDGNGDGIVDLFSTREDIVETSFGLLKTLGLDMYSWGNEVALPNTMDFQSKQGLRNLMTLDKWKDIGITSYNDIPLPKDSRSSFLVILEGY